MKDETKTLLILTDHSDFYTLCLSPPSAKRKGLHQPAGRGREDLQLAAGDGGCVRPRANHPGNPADLSGPEAVERRGLLSADQADQSRAAPQQPRQPGPLAPADLHELHLPAKPRHPTLPQVSSQKVKIFWTLPRPPTHKNWLHPILPLWCLSRIRELFPGTEIEMFAHFITESLKRTKTREYVPSQEEIMALLTRQEMTTTVYCHGGGSCKISINSHTTAGEVTGCSHCFNCLIFFFLSYMGGIFSLLRWWRS